MSILLDLNLVLSILFLIWLISGVLTLFLSKMVTGSNWSEFTTSNFIECFIPIKNTLYVLTLLLSFFIIMLDKLMELLRKIYE